jgi:inosine-uridine nucleoside N-ribohydrolase
MPPPPALIVDTDCGPDDLAALAFIVQQALPLRLVTTVHGLCEPGRGFALARRCLDALGMANVPVVAGDESGPPGRAQESVAARELHSELFALANRTVPPTDSCTAAAAPVTGSADAAAKAIMRCARQSGGGCTVLALGSLTNLARAAQMDPAGFVSNVKRIVVMGSPDGEHTPFNLRQNPAAFTTLLRTRVRLELVSGTLVPASQLQGVFADEDSSDKQPSAAALLLRKLGRHEWGGYFLAYDTLAAFAVCRSEAFAAPRRRYLREVSASGVLGQWEETETETEGGGAVYELPAVDVQVYRSFLRGQSTY